MPSTMKILDANVWSELCDVNLSINSLVKYKTDFEKYGADDYFAIATENGNEGDCEDYAMSKQKALVAKGWSIEHCNLATAGLNYDKENHLVLLADVLQDGQTASYCLDNNYNLPDLWYNMPYNWYRRQVPGKMLWRDISHVNSNPRRTDV